MSVYRNGILHFHLFRETGKQQFRHGSILRNESRKVCLSRLIYFSGHVVLIPCGNLSLAHGQFQHLFREDGNLALVQRVGFHSG